MIKKLTFNFHFLTTVFFLAPVVVLEAVEGLAPAFIASPPVEVFLDFSITDFSVEAMSLATFYAFSAFFFFFFSTASELYAVFDFLILCMFIFSSLKYILKPILLLNTS